MFSVQTRSKTAYSCHRIRDCRCVIISFLCRSGRDRVGSLLQAPPAKCPVTSICSAEDANRIMKEFEFISNASPIPSTSSTNDKISCGIGLQVSSVWAHISQWRDLHRTVNAQSSHGLMEPSDFSSKKERPRQKLSHESRWRKRVHPSNYEKRNERGSNDREKPRLRSTSATAQGHRRRSYFPRRHS